MDALTIDVVSDVVCPWCFIGKRRLDRAAVLLGRPLHIHWHPFQLNPGLPPEGIPRRDYRIAKFGSWEYSQQLDARVAENGRQCGIEFRHDRMARTPNSLRAHVLLAAALPLGPDAQSLVAERLFTGYFTNGEDVGDPAVLLSIANECGISRISTVADLDAPDLTAFVRAQEESARATGVQGVPFITFQGRLVSAGAAPEEVLADRLRELLVAEGLAPEPS